MRKVRLLIFIVLGAANIFFASPLLSNFNLNFAYIVLSKHAATSPLSVSAFEFHPSVLALQGRIALSQGETQRAIRLLSQVIMLGRASDVIYFQLGNALADAGDIQSALTHWRAAHAAPYFLQRGLALRHQKDWSGAEAALRTAVSIEPDDRSLLLVVGNFYWEWGNVVAARTYLRRALELETQPYDQFILRGEMAQLEARVEDAVVIYQEAVRAQPSRAEAYRRLAQTLDAQDKYADAIDVLSDGITRAPSELSLYLQLGPLLTREKEFAQADQLYQQAQHVDTQSDEPWLFRAQNALAWGHAAEAEQYLLRALQLEPNNPDTHAWLAEVRARQSP
jgi:tetratricopeptide (TPR) repeat protein